MLDSDHRISPARAILIVLVCTALLCGFWYFQTSDPNARSLKFTISAVHPNTVSQGDTVVVNDTEVGRVIDVIQRADGKRLRVRVERQYRYLLDRRMTHRTVSKTDNPKRQMLQLIPGKPPGPLIDDGDNLVAAPLRQLREPRAEKGPASKTSNDRASPTQLTAVAALGEADAAIPVDAAPPPKEKRFRIAVRRVSVADSKLNGKAWDVLQGAPDLVFEAWCGDTNILHSARYPNTYNLDLGPDDLKSEVFTWPDGQSVGIRVVDRDLRNDDTIGSVVLPASARDISGSQTLELTRENLVTFELTLTALGE